MPDSLNKPKTVAILGAGPVGLAAAAHVLERGMEPVVLEAGPQIGHAVRQWSHVPLFSPWEYAIDKASERLLVAAGIRQRPTNTRRVASLLLSISSHWPRARRSGTTSALAAW